jgi:[acyl-carrier-protein] S-malonyltransferase
MRLALLFPGQGAQKVGMGKDLYESYAAARRVFDQCEDACGLPLRRLCFEGPEEELARTDICQPAIFAVSAATLAVLGDLLDPQAPGALRPAYMAGLSLGEYTALYAADAIDLVPAARLVARRGALMQKAATAVPSGMVSVVGLDAAEAEKLARAAAQGQILTCANFNCPGQVVLSGEAAACERAAALAGDFGAAGAVPLKVAGAFHSEIMQPAAEEFAEALAEVEFRPPRVTVLSNVEAAPYAGVETIRATLLAQLTWPVRWQQSMESLLARGVGRFYEIGPGRVLAGLMRRIHRRAEVICLQDRPAVERLAQRVEA